MLAEIRHRPAFAALFVTLLPGESVVAAAGAMASMSGHIRAQACLFGGIVRAVMRRFWGGQALFMTRFSCAENGRPGEVVLSQSTCGDIIEIIMANTTLFIRPGAFVACGPRVRLGLSWAGFSSWFGGEGLFRLKVSGDGPVFVGAYGSVVRRTVERSYLVETGHLLAYEPTLSLGVALSGGIFASFFGRQGFVTKMRGQGQLYLQSRSIEALAHWTNTHLHP